MFQVPCVYHVESELGEWCSTIWTFCWQSWPEQKQKKTKNAHSNCYYTKMHWNIFMQHIYPISPWSQHWRCFLKTISIKWVPCTKTATVSLTFPGRDGQVCGYTAASLALSTFRAFSKRKVTWEFVHMVFVSTRKKRSWYSTKKNIEQINPEIQSFHQEKYAKIYIKETDLQYL